MREVCGVVALLWLLTTCGMAPADGDEPTTAAEWLKQARALYEQRKFDAAKSALDRCLKAEKRNAAALHMRGCVQFMRGKFAESVADFDAFAGVEPANADRLWQRGISHYYAGKYELGRKQFEGYENVDTNDVENAVWHFLCAAKKDGEKKARAGLLKIGKDGRVPMMKVYDLFRGTAKPADVLADANAGQVSEALRRRQLFYAHLYLGLYHDATGDAKKAREHMALAARKYNVGGYMWEVARVHLDVLESSAKKGPK